MSVIVFYVPAIRILVLSSVLCYHSLHMDLVCRGVRCASKLAPKLAPPRPIPVAAAALVHDLFPENSICQFIGDVLLNQFRDENFADLYSKDT